MANDIFIHGPIFFHYHLSLPEGTVLGCPTRFQWFLKHHKIMSFFQLLISLAGMGEYPKLFQAVLDYI